MEVSRLRKQCSETGHKLRKFEAEEENDRMQRENRK